MQTPAFHEGIVWTKTDLLIIVLVVDSAGPVNLYISTSEGKLIPIRLWCIL